jgi:hypothetical protein
MPGYFTPKGNDTDDTDYLARTQAQDPANTGDDKGFTL